MLLLILFAYVFQSGLFTGSFLAVALSAFYGSLATIFTKDVEVLGIVKTGVLVCMHVGVAFFEILFSIESGSFYAFLNLLQFVCASQPINSLAFIFDGLHFGASDFPYAAHSMVSSSLSKLEPFWIC